MNITDTRKENKSLPEPDPKSKHDTAYRLWRDDVAQLLDEKGHFSEAERWDYCDTSPRYKINRNKPELPPSADTVWLCSASHEHDAVLFAPTCDFRICPDCAHRHTVRLLKRYIPVIEKLLGKHPTHRLRTLTLTRSVQLGSEGFKEAAQEGFELIQKAMRKVVGPKWNKDGAGLLANWEVGPNGHKLHYHMIYLGPWVEHAALKEAWRMLTGGDYIVWINAVKHNEVDWQGAVIEALKYATKFYKDDPETGERKYLSPALTVELFEALKNTRRIHSWGSFYNIEPPTERVFCCEDCGSKMVRITIGHYELWRLTGFSDEGHRLAISKSLLKFRTANKSPPQISKTGKVKSKQGPMLPGFDKVPLAKSTHYDYE